MPDLPKFFQMQQHPNKKRQLTDGNKNQHRKNGASTPYPIAWYSLLFSQIINWLLYAGDGTWEFLKEWFPSVIDYFFEGNVNPVLITRRYEKKKEVDFQKDILARKRTIQANFDADKKIIKQKHELCTNWKDRSVKELDRKKTIDLAVGEATRYTDDLSKKPGWAVYPGESYYQGISDLCEDVGCWENGKKQKKVQLVTHQLTLADSRSGDIKDLKNEITNLQKKVNSLTRELNSCTEYVEQYEDQESQNKYQYDFSKSSEKPAPRYESQWQLPSVSHWEEQPTVSEEYRPYDAKPFYEHGLELVTWPNAIIDRKHPHWKKSPLRASSELVYQS